MELKQSAYPSYRQAKLAAEMAAEEIEACDDMEELSVWLEEKGNDVFGKLRDFQNQIGLYAGDNSYADCLDKVWRQHIRLLKLRELTVDIERIRYGT